jgi:hypothetical protein
MATMNVMASSIPNVANAASSLGEVFGNAVFGGGGGGARAQLAAEKAQAAIAVNQAREDYIRTQEEMLRRKTDMDAATDQQKIDLVNQRNREALRAADSDWMSQDARIRPAGVGVLPPTSPAIVQYDADSKAIHDRLRMIYGAGGNADQMAGGANHAIGGAMIQSGNANDFLRGNALNGHQLNDKNFVPGVDGPVPINPDGTPAKPTIKDNFAILQEPPSAENNWTGMRAAPIPGLPTPEPKLTDTQRRAAGFVERLQHANNIIDEQGVGESALGLGGVANTVIDHIPLAGRFFESPEFQRLTDAEKDMVTAVLRDESGATITDPEFGRDADKYFPRFGDTPDVLREKAERRRIQIENMRRKAGVAIAAEPAGGNSPSVSGAVTAAPQPGAGASREAILLQKAQEAIAGGADPRAVMQRLNQMLNGGGK